MTPSKARMIRNALRPLAAIWEAYLANELDDEARRFWGADLEHENTVSPSEIELYSGRGGKELLWLSECRDAAAALTMLKMQPIANPIIHHPAQEKPVN
tara:strand:- start:1321 stop:1617 length:297 start_codon:yes stop_codon:yes gene_type:complete